MILLKRKLEDGTYFEFDKILVSGYKIAEDYDRITQKYVNGNRRQFLSDYQDVKITIDLAPFDLETTKLYLDNLINGEYQYYSLKSKQYINIDMIIDKIPEITIDSAVDNNLYMGDFSITLLKAGDINA